MITKIELEMPEKMAISDVKDELIMRLHDAFLWYREDQVQGAAKAFEKAEDSVKDGDWTQAFKALTAWLHDLSKSQYENAIRIHDLFDRLVQWKNEPRSSALVAPEQFELVGAEVVDEFGMSQSDMNRLVELEFAIQKGVDAYLIAGEALREIRDMGLYKQYGTFEEYCEAKWQLSRSRAYQLIGAEEVVYNLSTSGVPADSLPRNEAQVRALSSVPVEKQAEVWNEARKDGKPSAAKIKAVIGGSALTPSPSPKGGEGDKKIPPSPPYEGGEREEAWNANLWETPTNIAKAIAQLLNEDEVHICEPVAGTGQIARAIVEIRELVGWEYELTAIEILKDRAKKLADNRYFSIDADFLDFDFGTDNFDVVITNPPFDIGMDVLERSLSLIKLSCGRCLFLLPIAYFSTQERAKRFAGMNAHIHKIYPIVGRVAYLKNGIPETGRQCDDAVFDIRVGKLDGGVEFIWQ